MLHKAENSDVHLGFMTEVKDGTTQMVCYRIGEGRDDAGRSVSASALLSSDRELCIAGGEGDCGIAGCKETLPHLHVHAHSPLCESVGCDSQSGEIVPLTLADHGSCIAPSAAAEDRTAEDGYRVNLDCENEDSVVGEGDCCTANDCKSRTAASESTATATNTKDRCCKEGQCNSKTEDSNKAGSIRSARHLIRKADHEDGTEGYVLACPHSRCRRRLRCSQRRILRRLEFAMERGWMIFRADGLPAGIGVGASKITDAEAMEQRRTELALAITRGGSMLQGDSCMAKTEVICEGICCAAEIPIVEKTLGG